MCNRGPISRFKNIEELRECAEYWIEKLNLNNWSFKFSLSYKEDMPKIDGETCSGYCLPDFVRKTAQILICKDDVGDVFQMSDEHILVHELLHCITPSIADTGGSFESVYWNLMAHQRLEMMTRTLISVKYEKWGINRGERMYKN